MALLKTCTGPCHGTYEAELAFSCQRPALAITNAQRYRAKCYLCEQTARDQTKKSNRWRPKATSTIRTHCEKYNARYGENLKPSEFADRFGWEMGRIAHQLEHSYSNGCIYCGGLYKEMGHGFADITIDITDPRNLPYYLTNTKICCKTCNGKKGDSPPEIWARKQKVAKEWAENVVASTENPMRGLALWDWSAANGA